MYKKFLYPIVKCKKLKSWIKYKILTIKEKAQGVWSEILTGTSFTLENSLENVFNKFDLKGNTLQDGTPTPDSPIPIQNVSGNNTITISNADNTEEQNLPVNLKSKNELIYNLETLKSLNTGGTWTDNVYVWNGITFTVNDDLSINTNGTASTSTYLILTNNPNLTSGTEYKLNGCPSGRKCTNLCIKNV